MIRSLSSVLAGYIFWSALWVGLNTVLPALFPGTLIENEPIFNIEILAVMLLWSAIDSVLSGFITAKVMEKHALLHGGILGALLLITGVFVQYQYRELMPLWYHLSFLVLLVPGTLVGALIGSKKTA